MMRPKHLIPILVGIGQVHAGLSWVSEMTISDSVRPTQRIRARVQAQAGMLREDFDSTSGAAAGMARAGTWWLFRADSQTVAIVNSRDKSYMEMRMDSVLNATTNLMGMGEMRLTDPHVDWKEGSDDTDRVPGAKAYTLHITYGMEVKILFMDTKTKIDEVRSIWVSPKWPTADLLPEFQRMAIHSGLPGLDTLIAKEAAIQKAFQQMVVHSVSTRRTTDAKGRVKTTITRMEVLDLTKSTIPSDRFRIPDGYKRNEMPVRPSSTPAHGADQSPSGTKSQTSSGSNPPPATPKIDPTTIIKGLFH